MNWYFDWRNPTTNISYNKSEADTTIAGTFSYGGYTHTIPTGKSTGSTRQRMSA